MTADAFCQAASARGDSASPRLLAVAGHPVSHSLSPRIHNCFAAVSGLPYTYRTFDVTPESLPDFLAAAKTLNLAGFNITMPLKTLILPHLDAVDSGAALYGAVNTVVQDKGRFTGYNTDGEGFLLSLELAGIDPRRADALILGAGGAAKAVAAALLQKGAKVRVACRRQEQAAGIAGAVYCPWADIFGGSGGSGNGGSSGSSSGGTYGKHNLLINATPLGMEGMTGPDRDGPGRDFSSFTFFEGLTPGALICDLIYAPRETLLLRNAKEKGFAVMNGLAHLVCQAALSFQLFTGHMPRRETVEELISSL